MVVVDEGKCVGCGRCVSFCTRHAIGVWGYAEIDAGKCSDCFGGVYYFEKNAPLADKERVLDRTRSGWDRLCIVNCPVDATSVKEHNGPQNLDNVISYTWKSETGGPSGKK